MSPGELIELIAALKASGVTHFKNADLELSFAPQEPKTVRIPIENFTPVSLEVPPIIPDKQAPHIVQQMKNLFTASDLELVDQLFPLPVKDES